MPTKEITITTQEELDSLEASFIERTVIHIRSKQTIILRVAWENSSVVAWDNSSVVAWDNSSVEARDNSSVVAWDNSRVVARENSRVEARDNSSVEARGNSRVVAWENSSVEARGNSRVVAWENSSVVAWDNSSVVAWDNSSVEARDNSSVEARENSRVVARECAVVICLDHLAVESNIQKHGGESHVIVTRTWTHTAQSFFESYHENIQADGRILLYKVTTRDRMDFHSNSIKYMGVVECPDWDPNPDRECGGGLHLSPTKELALRHHEGTVLKCLVSKEDIVVFGRNIRKVRCRKVEVIGEA